MDPFNGFFNTVKGLASKAVNAFESIGDQSQVTAPIQHTHRQRNRRAEAVLRGNRRSAAKPPIGFTDNYSERNIRAAGMNSLGVRNTGADGVTTHDLSFDRNTVKAGAAMNPPRRNMSPQQRQLRQANIKYQQGQLLQEVKPGDTVTSSPIPSDSGRNVRARIYDKMTNGALRSQVTDYAQYASDGERYEAAEIETKKLGNDKWRNIKGQTVRFDPKQLKEELKNLAKGTLTRRLSGDPLLQSVLAVDQAAKSKFGVGIFENASERKQKSADEAIGYIKEKLGL